MEGSRSRSSVAEVVAVLVSGILIGKGRPVKGVGRVQLESSDSSGSSKVMGLSVLSRGSHEVSSVSSTCKGKDRGVIGEGRVQIGSSVSYKGSEKRGSEGS